MNEEVKEPVQEEQTEPSDLYEFEIERYRELLEKNPEYAFQRYGLALLYSMPTEETFTLRREFGWKNREALDYYNMGVIDCIEEKFNDAMKHFEKAESMECEQPELFFNIAAIYEERDDIKSAKEYYQKYIDLAEQWDDIPHTLQEELDEAREHLKSFDSE